MVQEIDTAKTAAENTLLESIINIEASGLANAGTGCALSCSGHAELEASYAGLTNEHGLKFASVTAVPYTDECVNHVS